MNLVHLKKKLEIPSNAMEYYEGTEAELNDWRLFYWREDNQFNFVCIRYINANIYLINENRKGTDEERDVQVWFHGYGYIFSSYEDELRHIWFGHKATHNEGYLHYFMDDIDPFTKALKKLRKVYINQYKKLT